MNWVIERAQRGDGAAASAARAHDARDFDKTESLALQDHKRLDFGIFEREATAEKRQRGAVHADESGRRIAHRLAQNGPQHGAEEHDPKSKQPSAELASA